MLETCAKFCEWQSEFVCVSYYKWIEKLCDSAGHLDLSIYVAHRIKKRKQNLIKMWFTFCLSFSIFKTKFPEIWYINVLSSKYTFWWDIAERCSRYNFIARSLLSFYYHPINYFENILSKVVDKDPKIQLSGLNGHASVFLPVNKFQQMLQFILCKLLTFRLCVCNYEWFTWIYIWKWIYCRRLNHSMFNMTVQVVCNYIAANIIWIWHSLIVTVILNVYSFVTFL